jgi:hypothetical protein
MLLILKKILIAVFACLILFLLAAESIDAAQLSSGKDSKKGYSDIVFFKGKFFAVGTDGRIDCISGAGEKIPADSSCKVKLNCAFSNDDILIAAGDHGTILYSSDGKNFYRSETITDKNIYAITSKNGLIIAGTRGGKLLSSIDGKTWKIIKTAAKGNVISLSANSSFFIGITDSGEIIKSFDGNKWDIKNYNKEYAGYNRYTNFKKILAAQNSIMIIGTHDDGSPSILFSSLGNVWAERIPIYQDDEGIDCFLANKPNGITYDSGQDQFILACDGGVLFSLPSCSKCNEYKKISDDNLNALIYSGKYFLIVGDRYSVYIKNGM